MRPTPVLLLPLLCAIGRIQPTTAAVKQYYIAAVEIGWDYVHLDDVDPQSDQRKRLKDAPQKYIKAVYREYTNSTYTVPKARPTWTGIQGPVIVAQAGDRVVIHFKNLASQPFSISPVGITYWKQSEGAGYDDSTAGQEKQDDAVPPGGYYEYVWDINPKDGPTNNDPECLTYSYSSQVDTVRDMNSGLIGALLICKASAFSENNERRNEAFVLLFAVFDETKSWYGEVGERRSREKFRRSNSRKEYHTINGYINSTLPGLTLCHSRRHVFWHMIGVGTAPEIHSIQFQDHTLQVLDHRKVNIEVTPMAFITAEMKANTIGRFLISCQIFAHHHDGMNALFTVEQCPTGPDLRNANQEEDVDYNYEFNVINLPLKKPQVQIRSSRGELSKTWVHFIAAEEVTWDYTPHLKPTDSNFQSEYLPTSPHHLEYRYKKVAYVEYTDESFTQRKSSATTLLGPLLKGKVNDQFHIVFRNLASRPFNIYPNGLTSIYPLHRSANAAEKDLRSIGVPPNGTFGYIWRLTSEDGPLEGDPQCLAQLYQSTISPERDLASGLVGTLLICKHDAIDTRGHLSGSDKNWNLIFAVFDENRSWYFDENLKNSKTNNTDPEFYDSNVIYSVNGIMFSGRQLVICQTDVAFWHVANVGTQSDFLSVYFTGNLFRHQGIYHSVLTLFPMTAMTVAMEAELTGEWEISAFDGSLKSRGMSIYYTVRLCDNGELPLVSNDEEEDLFQYLDQIDFQPRGTRLQNGTGIILACKKPSSNNTEGAQSAGCQNVTITSGSDEGIPLDILEGLDSNTELDSEAKNETEHGEEVNTRQKRHVGKCTEGDVHSGDFEDSVPEIELGGKVEENRTDTVTETKVEENIDMQTEENNQMSREKNETKDEFEESNEILLDPRVMTKISSEELSVLQDVEENLVPQSPILSDPERQIVELMDVDYRNYTHNENISLSLEYDDYSQEENGTDAFASDYMDLRSGDTKSRYYYIAAEEIIWDYGIRKPHQLIKPREMRRGMRKFLPHYKKVVYRAYTDKDFTLPDTRGELQEHLGIMGPFIRAEINGLLTVIFKNKASRPFSFHLQGVYDRSQGGSIAQTYSSDAPPGVPGEPVPPGEARTYNWRIATKQGPTEKQLACKTGAYYSTVNKERDFHSGLIGPLIICKPGTLLTRMGTQPGVEEFALLFNTFDENKSWYLEDNLHQYCAPPCRANPDDPWYHISNKFAAINGYVAETLPGLVVAQHQQVRWHILNVGSDGEYHAVHFHGLPFTDHAEEEHRMGVYKLFPGVFGTLEMKPPTVGTWLVECTIGDYQLAGMRAKLLVYNPHCVLPLGMKSGRIEDSQITASNHRESWEPHLARLEQSGYINAWMGKDKLSWLQVDLLKPTLLHGVQTQGVRAQLRENYITHFTISYSLDQQTWMNYKGNRRSNIFFGNMDSSKVKENNFSPPFVARYIRIHPYNYRRRPALRMELLGCDLNSCSLPLGLQKRQIPDNNLTASSSYSSLLRSWSPALARLYQEGSANAWRPKNNNPHEWLQVYLGKVKRITGVVTQGARSLLTQMMVTEYSVTVSYDGQSWSSVLEENSHKEKIFTGNNDPDEEAVTLFDPPLFGRYLRIHPRGWINDIALRLEILGCDTQQVP